MKSPKNEFRRLNNVFTVWVVALHQRLKINDFRNIFFTQPLWIWSAPFRNFLKNQNIDFLAFEASPKLHFFVDFCSLWSLPSGGPMIPFPECIGFRLVFYTRRNAVNVTKKITNYFSHCVFKKLILLQKFRDIEIFTDMYIKKSLN